MSGLLAGWIQNVLGSSETRSFYPSEGTRPDRFSLEREREREDQILIAEEGFNNLDGGIIINIVIVIIII